MGGQSLVLQQFVLVLQTETPLTKHLVVWFAIYVMLMLLFLTDFLECRQFLALFQLF